MPAYSIGIDLGTTNSALAYTELNNAEGSAAVFPVPQLVNPGEVAPLALLSSSLYIPGENEFVEGALSLPWNQHPQYITGRLARTRGVENANRLVSSAKSWLSNPNADPTHLLLPVAAGETIAKVSPVTASAEYLRHLREAWNTGHPDHPLERQQVFLTVPASFDPGARELTGRAAAEAGIGPVTLLEEPQAAFYAWIAAHPNWRDLVKPGDLILVVDIGGGTTDFTLIAVTESAGELSLERVAVGEHLLLGGDNMDLAVARFAEAQLQARGTRLDAVQFHSLWQQCRHAKEMLLSVAPDAPSEHPLTVLGRGTGLIAGTIRSSINRDEIRSLLLEGFFPVVAPDASIQRQRRTALMEVGLQYASDPAITKHLAQFLRQAGTQTGTGFARPTHVLFNGGVLQSSAIDERVFAVLNAWLTDAGASPAIELGQPHEKSSNLMHAVSQGASYYGLAKAGRGIRIRGGVPRTYYVGIESSLPAIPGLPAPMKALTVVPFGLEEGSRVQLPERRFALIVGEPAEFRFFSSLTRKDDAPGTMLDEITGELEELSPVEVFLPPHQNGMHDNTREEIVPVTLESNVTETGLLELWCVAADGRRWKLEFNVRERQAA